ncbi:MAG TPA: hypothetical protein VEW26_14275 [Allosphingosinicella sp.]|nr:hypothetical protein [Allosphingosinicella sp.]
MPSYIRTRSEFAVNSFTADSQLGSTVATFADGGFIVAWGTWDKNQDGSWAAIKAQLFDSAGRKVGIEFQVNYFATGEQFTPSVATLDNGNFVVTWATSGIEGPIAPGEGNDGINARLFDRNGNPIGGEFQVNTSSSNSLFTPVVTALENGGFVISWDDWNGNDIKARIYDSSGWAAGPEFTLNANTGATQDSADITALANGGFVATWRTTDSLADGSGDAVKAQVFSATGARVGAEFLVNSQKVDSQYDASVTALAGGGFVITWATRDAAQDGNSGAIKGQIFTASGAKVGGEFLVNTQAVDIQRDAVVTGTPDGGFVVVWTNYSSTQDGSGFAIKAQAFDSAGAKVGSEMLVNTLSAGSQFGPDVATLADGRLIVTWTSETGDNSGYSVRAQILGTQPAAPLPNTAPIIISPWGSTGSLTVDEGVNAVTTVVASDDGEPTALRYSITGGEDAGLFTINALTGALAFVNAPDHVEGGDNLYSVTVSASDGQLSGSQQIYVTVRHVNYVDIVSDGGSYWAELWVDENQTAVTTVTAVDDDGLPLTYSLAEGSDSYLFTIDPQTGQLSFTVAPDYEAPADMYGQNVYYVTVIATDGTRSDSQDLAIYVNDVEEPEGFAIVSDGGGDYAELHVPENSLAVTVVAVGGAAGPVTYEIVGGSNAGWFEIDAGTGALSFAGPPDFETGIYGGYGPWYYDPYNYPDRYEVVVRASDGVSSDEQAIIITIDDVDEAPVFESYYGADHVDLVVAENDLDLGYVWASDQDRYSWVTYGIEGADSAFFEVDPYSGQLSFRQAPNYEAPADADGDNVYEVSVVAYSGELSATQSFSIAVADQWEPVSILSDGGGDAAVVMVQENGTAVTVVEAEGDGPIYYEIAGGADASWFTIDFETGALSFRSPADYESHSGENSEPHSTSYDVVVRASNQGSFDDQRLSVRVTDVDEAPIFASFGGWASVAVTMFETATAVVTVEARDPEGSPVTYALSGADAALFQVDSAGALSFLEGRDFEAPADSDGDNVYDVTVVASSGALSAGQAFAITIADVNENVAITSDGAGDFANLSMAENGTAVTQVAAASGLAVTYSIVGGADAAGFTIDPVTGALAFASAPNFEWTADFDHDNVYEVTVRADNGVASDDQSLFVTLTNVDEDPDFFDHEPGVIEIWAGENTTSAGILNAYDVDGGPAITYSVTGGADAALFVIDPNSGELSLVGPGGFDFEAPGDLDGDNVYRIEVTATAGGWSRTREFKVTLVDENEPIVITSNGGGTSAAISTAEGSTYVTTVVGLDPEGAAPIYSIVGGPDADRFTIDPATGVLSFRETPDFEAPADMAGANFYTVRVAASDGLHSAWQSVQIIVRNVNEGLAITSPATASVLENGTAAATIVASDVDGDPVSYAIAGGADAALFTIDASTGALTFRNAPNYEAPADSGGDNVYDVIVSATDGSFTDSKAVAITVGNVNEAVLITSGGGGAAAAVAVAENGTAVTVVAATDSDGGPVTYAIAGGADAARFTIDAATGALAFVAAPNFEAPADWGANNVYDVVVSASDGSFTDTQALAVTVGNVNEALAITSNGGGATASVSVAENGAGVTVVAASDLDGTAATYSIVGGADAARFTINPQTGALQFVAAPDYELPADSDQDNVYSVVVRASDGSFHDDQALSVSVGNVRDGNIVTGTSGGDSISATSASAALRTSNEEDTVYGRDGHDNIQGMAGDDDLYGEAGNDVLIGGAGADRLSGGLGKDTFTYNLVSDSTAASRDQILDFSRSQNDKISLSAIDANVNLGNNQAFTFIGTAAFSNVAGQLRYETSDGMTIISGDVNGDGVADLQILVSGSLAMGASDFVL